MTAQETLNDLLRMELTTADDVWVPTPHGRHLARVLAQHPELIAGKRVLELGAGVANHTILLLRLGAAHVTATEIKEEFLETTRRNVRRNEPEARNIDYRVADWLDTPGQFDLVITNPPFCKSGKQNRRYFIDSLILDAHKRLLPEGDLLFVQSTMADVYKSLARLEENGFTAREVGRVTGPFRDYYFRDPKFMEEIAQVPGGFEVQEDGTHLETLVVLHGKLRPFEPHPDAHAVV